MLDLGSQNPKGRHITGRRGQITHIKTVLQSLVLCSSQFVSMKMQRSYLMEEYPNILCECMWILTWTCDRTRGSRFNNFYKKGKGKKRKNILCINHT